MIAILLVFLIILISSIAVFKALRFGPVFSLCVTGLCVLIIYHAAMILHQFPIPKNSNKKENVSKKILVGKRKEKEEEQYDDVEIERSNSRFIFVFADWCGHCVRTKPVWENLSATYPKINEKTVEYRSLNSDDKESRETVQTMKKYNVSAFPFIVLERRKQGDYIIFKGKRDIQSFVSFLEKNI